MGRKSANKSKNRRSEAAAMQIRDLTDQLLRICSSALPTSAKLWEEHKTITSIIEKIINLEKGVYFPVTKREDHFSSFLQWIKKEGVADVERFTIHNFNDENWGLKAEAEIPEGQLWLKVPRRLMITSDDITNTNLAKILEKDPISKYFPQVALSLFILQERLNDQSSRKPYLDILPNVYDTVLYFSLSEFENLKGCSCLDGALGHYRNIVRQYAYYWLLFNKVEDKSFILKDHFTFNSYRWAVSTVMTRQNAIPSGDGTETSIALIPIWDMCNHSVGKISTDFDLEKNELQCFANRDFHKEDQIFISYGERPNFEFFIHNAFVYADNPCDKMALRLGMNKSDALTKKKATVLEHMKINQNEPFYLLNGSTPVPDPLLAFIHVFVMEESDLNKLEEKCGTEALPEQLKFLESELFSHVQKKAWNFLKIRLDLLLKSYKTTAQEDETLLNEEKSNLSSNRVRLAIAMRLSEKRILLHALDYVISRSSP